jgi:hypothetical protein
VTSLLSISRLGLGPAPKHHPAAPSHPSAFRGNAPFACLLGACVLTRSPPVHAQSDPASRDAAAPPPLAQSSAPTSTSTEADLEAFLSQTRTLCGDTRQARRFGAAVQVELSAETFTQTATSITKLVRCNVEQGVLTLRLGNRELTLDVSDVPASARARTLAVALAETLRLPPAEAIAASAPPPDVQSSQPTPQQDRLTPAPRLPEPHRPRFVPPNVTRAAGWQIPVTLRALSLGPRRTLALGATLGVSRAIFDRFRAAAHLGYLTSHDSSALGDARMHAVSIEGTLAMRVLRPSTNTTLDVGASAGLYEAIIAVDSVWGIDEPDVYAWFALWGVHAELSTTVSNDFCLVTHLRAVKDLVGRRLRAGGQEAMSFYGLGAELRLGAAYAW